MKIYNADLMRNKKKFTLSIIVGILVGIACGLGIGIYERFNPIAISFTPALYVLAAYGISKAVYEVGDGIGNKYAVVSIISFILCLIAARFFSTIFMYGWNVSLLAFYLYYAFVSYFSISLNSIIELLCIAYGFYICFYNSRMA